MSAKVLVERMELVRHLVDEAQRIAPGRIAFHWSCPCQVHSVPPGMPPQEDVSLVAAQSAPCSLVVLLGTLQQALA